MSRFLQEEVITIFRFFCLSPILIYHKRTIRKIKSFYRQIMEEVEKFCGETNEHKYDGEVL